MNNMTYIGIGIVVVIIIIGAVLLTSGSAPAQSTSTTNSAGTSGGQTTNSTTVTSSTSNSSSTGNNSTMMHNNTYNTTTTILSSNSSVSAAPGCTPTKYFTCSKTVYTYSGTKGTINFTLGQNTGQDWSGFGVGYAPVGTTISGGIPQNITFYNATASSNNVGSPLASGSSVAVTVPVVGTGASTTGTLWVCFVNSGVVYTAKGCTTSGGSPATYEVLATLNVSS